MFKQLLLVTAIVATSAGDGVSAQAASQTVRLPQAVLADGKPLAAGTYDVRLTMETVAPAPGQSTGGERWVEFVVNGRTAGRELATLVADSEIDAIAEGPRLKHNTSRVDLLKGDEFLRVWINRDGVNYLIHLPLSH